MRVWFVVCVAMASHLHQQMKMLFGGSTGFETSSEELWDDCESWDKVLRHSQKAVGTLRGVIDAYLRISYASVEDAELACGALFRVAEVWDEDPELFKDRRFAQLVEVVECRASEVGAASAAVCAWALSALGFRGPENLLEDLETACLTRIKEDPVDGSVDVELAAASSRAFACATAAFGGSVGERLRASIADAVVDAPLSVEGLGVAEAASLAASLAGSFGDDAAEDQYEALQALRKLVEALGAVAIDRLPLDDEDYSAAELASAAAAFAQLDGDDVKVFEALADASIHVRDVATSNEKDAASLAWGLAMGGQVDEAARVLDNFLDHVFDDQEHLGALVEPRDATRLVWALALVAQRKRVAQRGRFFCRAVANDAANRLDEFEPRQRARILWAAALVEADDADNLDEKVDAGAAAEFLAYSSEQDDRAETETFARAVGALVASLERDDLPLGASCRAAWAAVALGLPSARLCAAAEHAAGKPGRKHVGSTDLVRAVWACAQAAHRKKRTTAFGGLPVFDGGTFSSLVERAVDSAPRDPRLKARLAVSANALGGSTKGLAISLRDLARLAPRDVPAVLDALPLDHSVLDDAATSEEDDDDDLRRLKPAEAVPVVAALARGPLARAAKSLEDPVVKELRDGADLSPETLAALARACATLAERGLPLPALSNTLDSTVAAASLLRPGKRDLAELARAANALHHVDSLDVQDQRPSKFFEPGKVLTKALRTVFKLKRPQMRKAAGVTPSRDDETSADGHDAERDDLLDEPTVPSSPVDEEDATWEEDDDAGLSAPMLCAF